MIQPPLLDKRILCFNIFWRTLPHSFILWQRFASFSRGAFNQVVCILFVLYLSFLFLFGKQTYANLQTEKDISPAHPVKTVKQ